MIAEGGTERGHGVSFARGPSIEGPFESHPSNPVLSARSTSRPIQNTGHADLVETPEGGSALVMLGMRPLGATQSFSPLGRETFITDVAWADGWPQPEPVLLAPQVGRRGRGLRLRRPLVARRPGLDGRPDPAGRRSHR